MHGCDLRTCGRCRAGNGGSRMGRDAGRWGTGREEEIRRSIQVLSRRTKNNPVLIGEPGVGKTAIAEGLAQRIINKDVPESMKSKRVLSLDLGTRCSQVRSTELTHSPSGNHAPCAVAFDADRRADCGQQVPWRVRGAPQGRAQGRGGLERRGHPLCGRAAHHPRPRRSTGRWCWAPPSGLDDAGC